MKIIHIGAGARGRHWLEIVRDYKDATSVAFVDPYPKALEQARKLAGNTSALFQSDLAAALRGHQADAALITSPSFLHVEHAMQALEAGLHVLLEKPFATDLQGALRIIRKATALGKQVIVAENYRFYAVERTVRHWLAENRLGRVTSVVCIDRRNQPPSEQAAWVSQLDNPQLIEIAVHHFDGFRYLFQQNAARVTAHIFNPPGSLYRAGAATEALIEMEDGLPIVYMGTLVSHRYEYGLTVEGEKGCLWMDRRRVWWRKAGSRFFIPIKLVTVPKGDELPYPRAGTVSLLNQLRDAVVLNKEGETSGRDNFFSLAMVAAAAEAAQSGRKVSVADVVNSITSETDVALRSTVQTTTN